MGCKTLFNDVFIMPEQVVRFGLCIVRRLWSKERGIVIFMSAKMCMSMLTQYAAMGNAVLLMPFFFLPCQVYVLRNVFY